MTVQIKKQITQVEFLLFFFCAFLTTARAQEPRYIRVAISKDAASLSLKVSQEFQITDPRLNKIMEQAKNIKATITAYKEGISVGGRKFNTDRITISTKEPGTIIINGRKFRGRIQIIKNSDAKLAVINFIDLEDYIKGILYHESSHYWPMEVLKAQAIACRTYAVYQIQENKRKDFDVTADTYSQVYGGWASERHRTTKAVEETRAMILVYQDQPFLTFYHATCGGHSEDASLLWNIDIPPLKGVVCDFCQDSPHFNWQEVESFTEIKEKLQKFGYNIDSLKDITILEKNDSGRVKDLKILTDTGELMISAKDFRNIIGPNLIKSTNFNLNIEKQNVVFEGKGWGHGVGMCQWGAYFMAKQGYRAPQILEYYYPQTNVKTL